MSGRNLRKYKILVVPNSKNNEIIDDMTICVIFIYIMLIRIWQTNLYFYIF